ncbi:MAG: GtrA family protein [Clostridiales bacterium]|nr:GtrA family protein [Clostridiales bacterium]
MKKIKAFLKEKREILLYILFGALTTLVNFAAFWLFSLLSSGRYYLLNNAVAWLLSVIFAFVTNKLFVFGSKSRNFKTLMREAGEFFAARLFSLGVEEAGLIIFVEWLGFDSISFTVFGIEITGQLIAKVILAVVVVILNYFFSKFIIFAKNRNA